MGGKPAARMGDATLSGGPIIQGAASVLIGAPSGVACSECPGGMAVGNPVNPSLGAKVLSGETDIHLPGPMPFVLSRNYSSYQTDTPAPVGVFGPGWRTASEVSLLIKADELILNDNGGRSIHFDPLMASEISYSKTENLWLARGGVKSLPEGHALSTLWLALPEELRLDIHFYFVANDPLGPLWGLGYNLPYVPADTDILPQPLPARRTLQCMTDRFGRALRYLRDGSGPVIDAVTGIEDGAGRYFRLELIQLSQNVLKKSAANLHNGRGNDNGTRLAAVYLTVDPVYGDVPGMPLARYEYNDRGELITVYDRAGHPVRHFEYHPQWFGRMTAHQHAGRPVTRYTYDTNGKVITQTNPEGLDYQFDYQSASTTVTDSLGRQQVYHFEGEGGLRRLVRHQRADGSFTTSEYDGSGRMIAQTDALGRKTEFDLDVATGRVLGVTTPEGKQTRYGYNSQGQRTQTTQPDGRRTTQEYDELGRLIAESAPMKRTTRYEYANASSDTVLKITDPAGGEKTLSWTPYEQLDTYTDCSGKQTVYTYDRFGKILRVQQEEGVFSLYRYDNRGQLAEYENAEGDITAFRYNDAGDQIQVKSPDGSATDTTFDVWGYPIIQQSGGLTKRFRYDSAGRLITLVNENGAESHFSYDVMDRQTQEVGFDGRTQRYHYNVLGQLVRSEDQDLMTLWTYDEGNRLVGRERPAYPDGTPDTERWYYNDRGQLSEVSHLSNGYQTSAYFEHNDAGQLIQERQVISDGAGNLCWQHSVAHDYSALGLRTQTTQDGLQPLRWQTYGSGHLLGLALGEVLLIEFDRDDLHRERERRFGRYTLNSDYTRAGRLKQLDVNTDPWHPLSQSYQYDKRGQLSDILTQDNDAWAYQYDSAGRLVEARSAQWQQQYRYDPAGNRLTQILPDTHAAAINTLPQTNRLAEDDLYRYQYDAYGNLIHKTHRLNTGEEHHYVYDHSHRLIHYQRKAGNGETTLHARYCYDPLGRRVGKQTVTVDRVGYAADEAQFTWYGWDGNNLVLTEHNQQQVHTVYHPGSFVPLLRVESKKAPEIRSLAEQLMADAGVTLPAHIITSLDNIEQELRLGKDTLSEESQNWLSMTGFTREGLDAFINPIPETRQTVHLYHCDHLGTPLALINVQGQPEWQARLDPWGNVLRENNPNRLYQPIRRQGQHYDEESGLHYNRHRYYDSHTGRYVTQDPIGLRGGLNGYIYPLKPTQMVDALGLDSLLIVNGPTNGNPIGHTAIAIEGKGVYSYANKTIWGTDTTAYIARELPRRNTVAYVLKTTPEQEQKIIDYIKDNYRQDATDYGYITHNCATMIADALWDAGVAKEELMYAVVNGMHLWFPPTYNIIGMSASDSPRIEIPRNGTIPASLKAYDNHE